MIVDTLTVRDLANVNGGGANLGNTKDYYTAGCRNIGRPPAKPKKKKRPITGPRKPF